MGMVVELACSRRCTVATWGASSSRMGVALIARRHRVTPRRVSCPVRAAEEVGTEEVEKPSESEGEKGKMTATYSPPPSQKKWTGYVEKDTAGQTNIYAVEPTVYVAESVFSSGQAGTSAEGSSNNLALAFGFSLIAIASAATILLTVGKNSPVTSTITVGYSGPPLSYYIAKFIPETAVEESLSIAPDLETTEAPEEAMTVNGPTA